MVHTFRSLCLKYAPFILLTALLLWPLALNGLPFYIPDSASYLRGGATGFDTGMLMLQEWWQDAFTALGGSEPGAGDGSTSVVTGAINQAGGTRSLTYSLISNVLSIPHHSLLALVVVQAGAVAFVVLLTQRMAAPHASIAGRMAMMICIALLTTAAWNAATAIPDILAGVAIFGSIPLTLYLERLATSERIGLVLLLAFAITAHASHLPITIAALLVGAIVRFRLRRPGRAEAVRDTCWLLSAPVLALVTMFALSYAAFGTISIAPKRYPILLARSVEDGPGLRYLQDHCETEGYAICEVFGTNFPQGHHEFLWGQDGVRYRATAEQMDRIRAQEWPIVRSATAEYPGLQFSKSVSNFLRQFGKFGLGSINFKGALVAAPTGRIELADISKDWPQLRAWGTGIIYVMVAASLLTGFVLRRRLTDLEVGALLVVAAGLATNAAVCGVLSGVADRYQGRVIWAIPALLMVILLRMWSDGKSGSPSTTMFAQDRFHSHRRPLGGPGNKM